LLGLRVERNARIVALASASCNQAGRNLRAGSPKCARFRRLFIQTSTRSRIIVQGLRGQRAESEILLPKGRASISNLMARAGNFATVAATFVRQ
ncbi:hypothetical protein SE17_29555, partial [Kouleothrix aurantiaca]